MEESTSAQGFPVYNSRGPAPLLTSWTLIKLWNIKPQGKWAQLQHNAGNTLWLRLNCPKVTSYVFFPWPLRGQTRCEGRFKNNLKKMFSVYHCTFCLLFDRLTKDPAWNQNVLSGSSLMGGVLRVVHVLGLPRDLEHTETFRIWECPALCTDMFWHRAVEGDMLETLLCFCLFTSFTEKCLQCKSAV